MCVFCTSLLDNRWIPLGGGVGWGGKCSMRVEDEGERKGPASGLVFFLFLFRPPGEVGFLSKVVNKTLEPLIIY